LRTSKMTFCPPLPGWPNCQVSFKKCAHDHSGHKLVGAYLFASRVHEPITHEYLRVHHFVGLTDEYRIVDFGESLRGQHLCQRRQLIIE
jgi:hypothetical protein